MGFDKKEVNIFNYTLPVDIELFYKLKEKKIDKDFSSLEMQLFTKPQRSIATNKALKEIHSKKDNISTLGIFPCFRAKDGPLKIMKQLFNLLKIITMNRRRTGIILFFNNRKKELYYSQLSTFNSLYIQRRGGGGAIKYAVMEGLLLFANLQTTNAKLFRNTFNLKVLDFKNFDFKKYSQKDLEEISEFNKRNVIKSMQKSIDFWRDLFY